MNVLITGSTSGLGYQSAYELAKQGHHIVITGRNETKGKDAEQKLRERTGNKRVHFYRSDSSLIQEINDLRDFVFSTFPALDVLINNAGHLSAVRTETQEGLEKNFATNTLSPYLLTRLLLPLLNESRAGRVINLVTGSHRFVRRQSLFDFESEQDYLGIEAYGRTKLYNLVLLLVLTKEYPQISFFAADPSFNNTEMMRMAVNETALWPWFIRPLLKTLKPFIWKVIDNKPASFGSRSTVFTATERNIDSKTGSYYSNSLKIVKPSKLSVNKELRLRLLVKMDELQSEVSCWKRFKINLMYN